MTDQIDPSRAPALFVAHPGHELRLFGWILRNKPISMVLATGSRSGTDKARLQAAADVLASAGAVRSELFGVVLDRELYGAVLAGDVRPFLRWKARVVDVLIMSRPALLITDGWQLYSVAHDLAHVIGRLAATEASRRLGYEIQVLEYEVVPPSLAGAVQRGPRACRISLSEIELAEKHAAIESYPDIELEVIELRQIEGEDHARTETFFHPLPLGQLLIPPNDVPKYESFGEARRADGIYSDVIRWKHVAGIVSQLLEGC